MKDQSLSSVVHGYFLTYLPRDKGLQPSTIRSYRDSLRLFLIFVACVNRRVVLHPASEIKGDIVTELFGEMGVRIVDHGHHHHDH